MNQTPKVDYYRYDFTGRGHHHTVKVRAGLKDGGDRAEYRHEIEVSVSPTGRSVQVFANGERVYP
jgi:hypothetical protein